MKGIYHIGIGKRGQTAIIEARRDIDYLSCEIYDYMGQRITTKKHLAYHRYGLLSHLKNWRPDVYADCKYIIVS